MCVCACTSTYADPHRLPQEGYTINIIMDAAEMGKYVAEEQGYKENFLLNNIPCDWIIYSKNWYILIPKIIWQ